MNVLKENISLKDTGLKRMKNTSNSAINNAKYTLGTHKKCLSDDQRKKHLDILNELIPYQSGNPTTWKTVRSCLKKLPIHLIG